jgi:D-alanyl-D-alanine carboxypeptidase
MQLYERGALSLDDTLDRYLPEELVRGIHVYQGHDYSHEITIRQLLSHTSGLPDYYEDKAADGSSLFELLLADPTRTWTVDEELARARDQMTPHFVPATAAYYSDTNHQLLGKIIENVTGEPLATVFQNEFFTPLSLNHTWLVGRSLPNIAPSQPPADVFNNDANISAVHSNTAFWADGDMQFREGKFCRFSLPTTGRERPDAPEWLSALLVGVLGVLLAGIDAIQRSAELIAAIANDGIAGSSIASK